MRKEIIWKIMLAKYFFCPGQLSIDYTPLLSLVFFVICWEDIILWDTKMLICVSKTHLLLYDSNKKEPELNLFPF